MAILQNSIAPAAAAASSYALDNSCRFNDSSSTKLERTNGLGDLNTFTISFWMKLGTFSGARRMLFVSSDTGGSNYFFAEINTDDKFRWGLNAGGGGDCDLSSTRVLRDPSAWYHIVLAVDTSTGVASANKMRLYINGVEETQTGTALTVDDYEVEWNATAYTQWIGAFSSGSLYFDGYLADIISIDGSQLTPTSFAERDSNGQWVPKEYSGSYPGESFRLDFADSAALGDDVSGNSNDFTAANLGTDHQTLDNPGSGDNFCTWNPLHSNTTGTLSEGNLETTNDAVGTFDALAFNSYWEITLTGTVGVGVINAAASSQTASLGSGTHGIRLSTAGALEYTSNGSSWTGITTGLTGEQFPYVDGAAVLNTGQSDFSYSIPATYNKLMTGSLPAPGVNNMDSDGDAVAFNALTHTGDGTSSRSFTGMGFQPALSIVKQRDLAQNHGVWDSVRGVGTTGPRQYTDAGAADGVDTDYGHITSFDSDGFTATLGGTGGYSYFNRNTEPYISWNWKAGSTATNEAYDASAGFSIVKYAGTYDPSMTSGANPQSVSHNLGVAPELMLIKDRDNSQSWAVYHKDLDTGSGEYLVLDTNAAVATSSSDDPFAMESPTSSVFKVATDSSGAGTIDINTDDGGTPINYIAYLFASVDGYSKVGSYTGNNSTPGTFVYCGFRPAMVWVKGISSGSWNIWDKARSETDGTTGGFNAINATLFPDTNGVEAGSGGIIDFTSNGFKIRFNGSDYNSAETKLFYAVAENPFKYSVAR